MHSKLDDAWTNRDAAGSMAPVRDFNAWDGSYPEPAMGERYVGSSGTTTQTALYAAARLQLTDAFKFIDGRLNAALALFRIDQENLAEPDVGQPLLPNGDRPYRAAQGVISEGYEFEVSGELATDWHLSLGWTHYSAKDADDVDVAVDHARELFRLFTKYTLPGRWHGLGLGVGLTWEGDRPATATNPATGLVEKVGQPAYAMVDTRNGRHRVN